VSRADALNGCERILRDEFTEFPEKGLYMIGAITEARGKARPAPAAAPAPPPPKRAVPPPAEEPHATALHAS
jgi:F-type H+-transporting ATPase subunit beta